MESPKERETRSGSREVCKALGLLLILLAPVAVLWGVGQYDLSRCFVYGGSDSRCVQGSEMMGVGLKVGAAMVVGGAVLLLVSREDPVDATHGWPSQTAMERYRSDLQELSRRGTITEDHYQERLRILSRLATQKAEAAITDDEFEAAAARRLDPEIDLPPDADEPDRAIG